MTGKDGRSLIPDNEKFALIASRLDEADQLALLAILNKARGGPEMAT